MRKTTWIVIGLAAVALAVGCSISNDEDTGPAAGGSAGGAYSPTPNGVGMGEQEACDTLLNAIDDNVDRLGCTYTRPDCPGYIRRSGAPDCSEYDQGTIEGCADFYATFTSCKEFESRPCHINNIENSAPNGCTTEEDGGTDAEADAEEADAEVEAAVDAEVEAAVDAEVDAEVDAAPDADEDGGAADAATD